MWKVLSLALLLFTCCKSADKKEGPVKPVFAVYSLIDPDSVNAGILPYGKDTLFRVRIRCVSESPLVIFKTEGSCVCTTVDMKTPVTLRKGDTLTFPVKYNTKLTGPVSHNILVFNNTESNPLIISIKGTVRQRSQP